MSRVTVETGGTVVKLCLGKETMRFHQFGFAIMHKTMKLAIK